MKSLEKRLSAALHTQTKVDDAQIAQTVQAAQRFYAAKPLRQHISFGRFVAMQARIFGVRIWLWQGGVMLALLYGLKLIQVNASLLFTLRTLPFLLGCCGVVAVTATIPLIYRSVRYRMYETECACYFSGAQQLLAHLLFMGVGTLLTLAVTVGVVVGQNWLGVGCAVVYVCAPCLTAICGNLALLRHMPLMRFPLLGSVLGGGLVLAMRLMLHFSWYPQQLDIGGGMLCMGLALLCAVQVYRLAHTSSLAMG